jgi:long-chain acyl-CoA synthetase
MENSKPKTLVELLKGAATARQESEVLRFKQGEGWVGMTGKQLLERVRNAALGLYQMGIRKGDKVAILAESGPLWTISDYAILSNGAINVPIYPTQAIYQVEYILRESEPALLLISTARQVQRISQVLEKVPNLRIITFQPVPDLEGAVSFDELEASGARLAQERPEAYERISSEVQPSDLASIIYTSGTTGEPKGVMLTHSNIVFNAIASGQFLGVEPDNVMLSFLPLSHIFERMVLYLCLHFGVQINYAGGLETVASDLCEVRPTLMSTVPRMLEKVYGRMQKAAAEGGTLKHKLFDWALGLAQRFARLSDCGESVPPLLQLQLELADRIVLAKLREALGGRIKRIVSGGAALAPDIALALSGAGIPVLQGYGLTETSPVIAVNTLEHNRIGSVGRPLPGIEVKIAEDGEILTRGPHVFQGYFKKLDETRAAFISDSQGDWFKTGDIGHIDEDGFLFITDRKKDLIKTSAGKYVAPQPIENRLGESEFIEQAVLVGNDRKYVAALIVPDFERLNQWAKEQGIEVCDRRELIEDNRVVELMKTEVNRLTEGFADYEKVKQVAILPQEFSIEGGELTPTLKVRRRWIEQKYSQIVESLYR